MGGGCVKNFQKFRDVIYGNPKGFPLILKFSLKTTPPPGPRGCEILLDNFYGNFERKWQNLDDFGQKF